MPLKMSRRKPNRLIAAQAGFTLVEMMVALSVLATIITVVAVVVTRFNVSNRRAVTQTTTLTTTRAIESQMSELLQFTDITSVALPGGSTNSRAYCIGDQRVSYLIGRQYTSDVTHALVIDRTGIGCGGSGLSLESAIPGGVNYTEYLGENMRLSRFDITVVSSNLYEVVVRVVYGDDDLLCSPAVVASCTSSTTMSAADLKRNDLQCKVGTGSEFCAVTELLTTVRSRL